MRILALILIIASFTNPKEGQHKEILNTKLNILIQKNMEKEQQPTNEWGQMGQELALKLGTVMVNNIIDKMVIIDNYFIFSITKIKKDDKTKLIVIGAFGNVFFTKKLDDALANAQ